MMMILFFSNMPRYYLRKTPKTNESLISRALEEIGSGGQLNTVAKKYEVPRGVLRSRVKRGDDFDGHHRQILTDDQELALVKHLIRAANMFNGFSLTATRRLAYEFAIKLRRRIPENWRGKIAGQSGSASKDWMLSFMKRHPTLSLRKPQATSLGRVTAFNKHNVDMFFTKLKDVIGRFGIEPGNIWNMDESALTTVQKPTAVVAQRGVRNLGSTTSAERGVLVTLALAISAGGMCLPPFYVFPRKQFRDDFLAAAGIGADGAANPSGWMKGEQFLKFLNHFKKYARPTQDSKTLLILDNHESHMSIAGLDFCKANGIVMLSLPPHTSHKLQPLDRGVFGPIKAFYNAACDNWMRMPQNAARTITMHDIPGIAREPIQKGASISNIQAGFRACGICPLNENIFTEIDFLPSEITNRPEETIRMISPEELSYESGNMNADGETSEEENQKVLDVEAILEDLRPPPKAPPRKSTSRGRKRRRSAVLTDEVEMEALRAEQEATAEKKQKQILAIAARAEKKILNKVLREDQAETSKNSARRPKRCCSENAFYIEDSDEYSD